MDQIIEERVHVGTQRTPFTWVSSIYLMSGFLQLVAVVVLTISFANQRSSEQPTNMMLLSSFASYPLLVKGLAGVQLLRLKPGVVPLL